MAIARRHAIIAVCACVMGCGTNADVDQSYPTRPVRLIVGAAPGGGSDILARKLSPGLAENLGQAVVVENKPGAGGVVGASAGAAAAPDGYTLTLISSSHASNSVLNASLPYDPVESYSPIVLFALSPQALVVHPDAPFKTVDELLAYSNANPGRLNMGSSGVGGIPHLSGELLKTMSGISFGHIPFKGGGEAMLALMARRIDFLFVTTSTARAPAAAGQLRIIGVASAERLSEFPEVPTISEAGVPGYEASNWAGVLAPAGTPADVVATVADAFLETIGSEDVNDWLIQEGLQPVAIGPEEFRGVLRSDMAKWAKVATDARIGAN